MQTKNLYETFKEDIDVTPFINFVQPFQAITSEVLEDCYQRFLNTVRIFGYKTEDVLPFEVPLIPREKMMEVSKDDKIKQLVLNATAFQLMRSGKIKNKLLVIAYQERTKEYLIVSLVDVDPKVLGKMVYVLSPRIHKLLQNPKYETPIINMLTRKGLKIDQGRAYAFLKSHLLVEGDERPVLKNEVQNLFKALIAKNPVKTDSEIMEIALNNRYLKISKITL